MTMDHVPDFQAGGLDFPDPLALEIERVLIVEDHHVANVVEHAITSPFTDVECLTVPRVN
jgi:hypothetical protein